MSFLDDVRGRVQVSAAEIAEAMTDHELQRAVMDTGISPASAAAAVDVFRMVLQAVGDQKITPRDGWARKRG